MARSKQAQAPRVVTIARRRLLFHVSFKISRPCYFGADRFVWGIAGWYGKNADWRAGQIQNLVLSLARVHATIGLASLEQRKIGRNSVRAPTELNIGGDSF
jgi:hypothetical protein